MAVSASPVPVLQFQDVVGAGGKCADGDRQESIQASEGRAVKLLLGALATAGIALVGFFAASGLAGSTRASGGPAPHAVGICHYAGPHGQFTYEEVWETHLYDGHSVGSGFYHDIIPAFHYASPAGGDVVFDGQNLGTDYGHGTTGADLLANQCSWHTDTTTTTEDDPGVESFASPLVDTTTTQQHHTTTDVTTTDGTTTDVTTTDVTTTQQHHTTTDTTTVVTTDTTPTTTQHTTTTTPPPPPTTTVTTTTTPTTTHGTTTTPTTTDGTTTVTTTTTPTTTSAPFTPPTTTHHTKAKHHQKKTHRKHHTSSAPFTPPKHQGGELAFTP